MRSTEEEAPKAAGPRIGPLRARRRRLRLATRRYLKRPLVRLALALIVPFYLAYMRLVWWTSRFEDEAQPAHAIRRAHDGLVCVLWHEEVFLVPWAYRDFRPHTLASAGDAGEAIARLLERSGFVVFRGDTAARRRREVLGEMIEHMKRTRDVLYGITVDGSSGPRYRLKKGAVAIARDCRKPLVCVRTWAKRNVRVPTWDRMAIPLPFNRIHRIISGPYFVPEDAAADPRKLEAFRRFLERELAALAEASYARFSQPLPPNLFAED